MWRKVTAKQGAKGETAPDPDEGFYRVEGTVYRVQKARSTDNRYAKVLSTDGGSRTWTYVGRSPFSKLTPDTKLTLADAEAHGLAYGWCLRCGRDLTVPESVERGIGPVCAKKWVS
jgi:hypothetical protein